MRLFIALPVPEEVKAGLAQAIEGLKSARADVKWVESNNLHLTIKFLGEVEEDRIANLKKGLALAAPDMMPLGFEIGRPGFFPNNRHPRILWLGINGDVALADELGRKVDQALMPLGFQEEKRSWHITLGRFRSERNMKELLALMPEALRSVQGLRWRAQHYSLIESQLTPRGPIYKELERYSL